MKDYRRLLHGLLSLGLLLLLSAQTSLPRKEVWRTRRGLSARNGPFHR